MYSTIFQVKFHLESCRRYCSGRLAGSVHTTLCESYTRTHGTAMIVSLTVVITVSGEDPEVLLGFDVVPLLTHISSHLATNK